MNKRYIIKCSLPRKMFSTKYSLGGENTWEKRAYLEKNIYYNKSLSWMKRVL